MFLPLLLALSACNNRNPEEAGENEIAADVLAGMNLAAGEDPARVQELVARAVPAALGGVRDTTTRNVRAGAGGTACGEVTSKATGGKFLPFVVTPEGAALIAPAPAIAFGDPEDVFADAWIQWCATPEELQRIAPVLREAAGNLAALPLDGENSAAAPDIDMLPPPSPMPEEKPQNPPPVRNPPPKPEIESFFNSVDRPGK